MWVLGQTEHFPSLIAHCLIIEFKNYYLTIPQLMRIEDKLKNLAINNFLLFLNSHYESYSPITCYYLLLFVITCLITLLSKMN